MGMRSPRLQGWPMGTGTQTCLPQALTPMGTGASCSQIHQRGLPLSKTQGGEAG